MGVIHGYWPQYQYMIRKQGGMERNTGEVKKKIRFILYVILSIGQITVAERSKV
jgi:hypothetical protein